MRSGWIGVWDQGWIQMREITACVYSGEDSPGGVGTRDAGQ